LVLHTLLLLPQDLTGKAVGIWLPISAFACIGFEHCIANQFVILMGIAKGHDISAKEFIAYNLIPSTIGNFIGGGLLLATAYAFIYGTPSKKVQAAMTKLSWRKPAAS
jgi:formate transporter